MTTAVVEAPFDLRAAWNRWRLLVVLAVAALGVAVALAVIENAPPQRPLDPRDASPVGARALAVLLGQRGVDVVEAATVPADLAGTTVFVPDPKGRTRDDLDRLAASTADLVVVAPASRELSALRVQSRPVGVVDDHTVPPGCDFPPARVAGSVRYAGTFYEATPPLTACYRHGGVAGLLVQQRAAANTTVLGSAWTLSNAGLRDEGDAALALGLLSAHPRLVWLLPRPPTRAPADTHHRGLLSLLPDRLLWALLQLFVVLVVVALWRGRRLGPVVAEPLPVVVRAGETVRGRAGLLRAARARDTAAAALRAGARRRVADLLGLGADAAPAAVTQAAAQRTGRAQSVVNELLYGAAPPDDATLVRLATQLDDLETAVRRS